MLSTSRAAWWWCVWRWLHAGGTSSPASPAGAGPRLTAPTPDSPADSAAVTTLRPTFVVRNGSADSSAAKLYEFQVSDKSDSSPASSDRFRAFTVVLDKTGVPEGSSGSTSYTPDVDPAQAYYWKGNWSNNFHLVVQQGIGGRTLYDLGISISDLGFEPTRATYNPNPHFAYLGANNGPFGEEDGSFPGAVYRNVWIGPRPASLGSALAGDRSEQALRLLTQPESGTQF